MKVVLFTIGNFNVYSFGFFLGVSFLLSTFLVFKYSKDEFKESDYLDTYLYTTVVALISARLVYIILHFNDFGTNILRYILVRDTPGLSLLGALIGGYLFLWWYSLKKKYVFLHLLDIFSIAVAFALVFAKIGQQLGGAAFGRQTNSFLGVRVIGLANRYHPTELYEAFLFLILSFFLTYIYNRVVRKKWPPGVVFNMMAVFSLIIIFSVEFFKSESVYLYGLTGRQIASLILIMFLLIPLTNRIIYIRKIR